MPKPLCGWWPEFCVQRAFVEGAKWWQFHAYQATMFSSERDDVEAEAIARYGQPTHSKDQQPYMEVSHHELEGPSLVRDFLFDCYARFRHLVPPPLFGNGGNLMLLWRRDMGVLQATAIRDFVARVNARAESDMLAGNPVTGAHHRALEEELKRLDHDVHHPSHW